ncbi:MAG: hypothetical protein P8X42_12845, partial [Calditrichaceae bacterium]
MLPFLISVSGGMMFEKIDQIKKEFEQDCVSVNNADDLEKIRIKYLGRKGKISAAFQFMSEIKNEDKPKFGQKLNQLKI